MGASWSSVLDAVELYVHFYRLSKTIYYTPAMCHDKNRISKTALRLKQTTETCMSQKYLTMAATARFVQRI